MHIHMARNVALSEKAYSEISRIKRENESFSSVVLRLLEKDTGKPSWRDSFGALKDDPDIGKIFEKILRERHSKPAKKALKW